MTLKKLNEEWSKIGSLSNNDVTDAYIAYFDILGYHQLVEDGKHIEICKLIEKVRILPLIKYLERTKKEEFKSRILSGPRNSKKESYEIKSIAFSDNILLSTPIDWYLLLRVMIDIQASLIQEGIFIRGAMVRGKLYHSDTLVGGEGLIMAHKLESKVAVYPRIIVDKSYIAAVKTVAEKRLISDSSLTEYLKLDFDKNYFLDYLKFCSETEDGENFHDIYIKKVEKEIKNNKDKHEVLAKYNWCKTYYEEFMRKSKP